jgi:hypothetical protein
MTLETKLGFVNKWTHKEALDCWTKYHKLYFEKHKGAFFQAQINGNHYQYIQKECQTFRRYAQMWKYQRGIK